MPDTWFVARALGLGSLIGFWLGALGAGGSILTVPILVYAMGVPVQAATSTSLAIVCLNAATGALDYVRRGRSLVRTGLAFGASVLFAAGGTVGVGIGAGLARRLPERALRTAFALVIAGIGVYSLARSVFTLIPLMGIY